MNMKQITSLLMTFCMLMLIFGPSSVFGLHCWECNSETNKTCNEIPSGLVTNITNLPECVQKFYVECSNKDGKVPFCRKQVQTIQNEQRIIRNCAYEKAEHNSYMAKNPSVVVVVNQCFTDGCNASFTLSASVTLLISLFALERFFNGH